MIVLKCSGISEIHFSFSIYQSHSLIGFFELGLQAAPWVTAAIANTWIREVLFSDLGTMNVPTLIIHGIHDKIVPFSLGEVQKQGIKNSKLIPFKYSGHGAFYDQRDKFNEELVKFIKK